MDFTLAPEVDSLRQRLRAFVEAEIMPLEADPAAYDEHENIAPARLEGLRAKATAAGLWALQMPKSRGGQGLDVAGMAACYEEMGSSIFGPVAFNCRWEEHTSELLSLMRTSYAVFCLKKKNK